jgi:hypothetical protein
LTKALTHFPTEPVTTAALRQLYQETRKMSNRPTSYVVGFIFVSNIRMPKKKKRNRTGSGHSDDVINCNCVAPARREYFCLVLLKDVPYTLPTFQHNVANNLPGIQAIGTRQTNPDCHIPSTSKESPRRRSPRFGMFC